MSQNACVPTKTAKRPKREKCEKVLEVITMNLHSEVREFQTFKEATRLWMKLILNLTFSRILLKQ